MNSSLILKSGHKWIVFCKMIKIEHSVFALPFAYLGLLLAEGGWPRLDLFLWVTLAMVSFRSMAMALNRIIDREIDGRNPRTQNRALPAGLLRVSFVGLITGLCFVVFELTAYKLGRLCFFLSPVPVILAILYPFAKRFTWFSHFILGTILGMAPYGAWLASRGEFSLVPGLLMTGVASWVAGFDIIYALQDLEFDRKHRLYSFPARFGYVSSLHMTRVLHTLTVLSWLGAGFIAGCGVFYFAGMLVVIFFLLREHWLVRSFGLDKIQEAFFSMNAIISFSVLIAALIDITLGGTV